MRHRDKAIRHMESILQELSKDPSTGVQFVPESRTMAIFKETSYMVSSRHGHPIHRDPEHPKEKPFPWKKLGYLRCGTPVVGTATGSDAGAGAETAHMCDAMMPCAGSRE